jgi:hypothetical protein
MSVHTSNPDNLSSRMDPYPSPKRSSQSRIGSLSMWFLVLMALSQGTGGLVTPRKISANGQDEHPPAPGGACVLCSWAWQLPGGSDCGTSTHLAAMRLPCPLTNESPPPALRSRRRGIPT